MPLIATSRPPTPVSLGVGCWMAVRGTRPAEFIWVVATRETLEQLDASELPEFLLDREPKESILRRFDVIVTSRYFPDFERELPHYLSQPSSQTMRRPTAAGGMDRTC